LVGLDFLTQIYTVKKYMINKLWVWTQCF